MLLHSFPAPFPRFISSRSSLHLAVFLVCTALEISWFSFWIQGSPEKIAWRRFRFSARIATSRGKKGYISQMWPAGMFLEVTLTKLSLKRCSPTLTSLDSNTAVKASSVLDLKPSQLTFLKFVNVRWSEVDLTSSH